MEKLKTIQKRENLNEVYAADEKGNGGANHEYLIRTSLDGVIYDLADIQFQNGARKERISKRYGAYKKWTSSCKVYN